MAAEKVNDGFGAVESDSESETLLLTGSGKDADGAVERGMLVAAALGVNVAVLVESSVVSSSSVWNREQPFIGDSKGERGEG